MTLTTVPDLLVGPAPPVDAGSGLAGTATGNGNQSTDPSAPSAFATLLQAAAGAQSDGETASPLGDTPLLPGTDPSTNELLAALEGLVAGLTPEAQEPGTADQTEPIEMQTLLDRLAEVGTTTGDGLAELPAVEALMAYLLMAQPVRTEVAEMPSLPEDVLALLQGTPESSVGDLLASLQGDEPAEVPTLTAATGLLGGGDTHAAQPEGAQALVATALAATTVPDGDSTGVDVPTALAEGQVPVAMPSHTASPESEVDAQPASDAVVQLAEATADASRDNDPASGLAANEVGTSVAALNPKAPAVDAAEPALMPILGGTGPTAVDAPEMVVASRPVTAATMPMEIADTVRMATFRGDAEVRLVLNPPDLGHLDIRIATGDGGLRVVMEASQGDTHDLIDRSLVQLQQALESRDVRVERIEVRSADGGRSSMDTSGQQSQRQSAGDDGRPDWSPIAALGGGIAEAPSESSMSATPTTDGRVDVMA